MQLVARDTGGVSDSALLEADDVIPQLDAWLSAGARACLVTLIASGGPGPRAVGAQMAVRDDGTYAGYLSGGCLERAIVTEAKAAMAEKRNRHIRFGGADGYIDMTLPCGAAIELYVDQGISGPETAELLAASRTRRLAMRSTDLVSGTSGITIASDDRDVGEVSRVHDGRMLRLHRPRPRLILLGSSPLVVALARLASHVGLTVDVATPDPAMASALAGYGIVAAELVVGRLPSSCRPDTWSAAIVAFHEHESEPVLLAELLAMPGFYVGALGSRAVHARRLEALARLGTAPASLTRLQGAIGAIAGAKTQAALAVGIISDVLAAARDRGFVD